ncbi:mobile element protein [Geminocystis sp. NIES-3708]|uniref:hypothetical protein n=1 Tax=Geminocystis sp. NIES-3708 TaxID=1615909 RepID=UPI0005FC655F|nr:hypothetical protein [Geminocystis sp. NIES-3708]BAQ63031.1 mobile element protein [Geminocystis sp. NIES-3708]
MSKIHVLKIKAQKQELRNYLGGLLGYFQRKNIRQITSNNVDIIYHKLHHFLKESTYIQTKISLYFSLIIDDSEHCKIKRKKLKISLNNY